MAAQLRWGIRWDVQEQNFLYRFLTNFAGEKRNMAWQPCAWEQGREQQGYLNF